MAKGLFDDDATPVAILFFHQADVGQDTAQYRRNSQARWRIKKTLPWVP